MSRQLNITSPLRWYERINVLNLLSLKNSFKRWCTPSFRPLKITNKEAHSRNEGTHSFQRRHKMFKIWSQPVLKNAKEENQLLWAHPTRIPHFLAEKVHCHAAAHTRPSSQSSRESAGLLQIRLFGHPYCYMSPNFVVCRQQV